MRYTVERLKFFQKNTELPTFYVNRLNWENKFDENDVVFGLRENIELMYYTNVAAAYNWIPTKRERDRINADGYDIFFYQNGDFIEEEVYLENLNH